MSGPVKKSEYICPLCGKGTDEEYFQDKVRKYLHCPICPLVFVPPEYFLDREGERAEYDLHRNSPDDLNYRKFLSRLFIPLNERLAPKSTGLDFGSGPGPTLSLMFEEAGHSMRIYDPIYAPDESVLRKKYDFITATEVVEHLRGPGRELQKLWACLAPGGWLGIMTKMVIDRDRFSTWHYKNDRTHISFYSQKTFQWLADGWRADLVFSDSDVILFKKNG